MLFKEYLYATPLIDMTKKLFYRIKDELGIGSRKKASPLIGRKKALPTGSNGNKVCKKDKDSFSKELKVDGYEHNVPKKDTEDVGVPPKGRSH